MARFQAHEAIRIRDWLVEQDTSKDLIVTYTYQGPEGIAWVHSVVLTIGRQYLEIPADGEGHAAAIEGHAKSTWARIKAGQPVSPVGY